MDFWTPRTGGLGDGSPPMGAQALYVSGDEFPQKLMTFYN